MDFLLWKIYFDIDKLWPELAMYPSGRFITAGAPPSHQFSDSSCRRWFRFGAPMTRSRTYKLVWMSCTIPHFRSSWTLLCFSFQFTSNQKLTNNAHKNSCPRARYSLIPSIALRPTIQNPSKYASSWLDSRGECIPTKVTAPVCTFLIILPILDRMTDSSISCKGRKLPRYITGQKCAKFFSGYSFEPSGSSKFSKLLGKNECLNNDEMSKLDTQEGTCYCPEWESRCKWPEVPN
jgi:hypothetical protein